MVPKVVALGCATTLGVAVWGAPAAGAFPGAAEGSHTHAGPSCVMVGTAQWPFGPEEHQGYALDHLPAAPGPAPVQLRTATATFNDVYEFAVVDGSVVVSARGTGQWHWVPLPGCLRGQITALSADDDELVAIGSDGYIYTMDHAAGDPRAWNFTSFWGAPLWTGAGRKLPPTRPGGWALSVASRSWDGGYNDAAGVPHPIGDGKMTMVVALSEDGTRITIADPWLPNDDSHTVPGPLNGRFAAQSLSAAASTIFIQGANGDMFVRAWDYDRAGTDPVFFRYHWDNRFHLPWARNQYREFFDPTVAGVQLPAPAWIPLPKIPGEITSAISISAPQPRLRSLRVEGKDNGRDGYWEMLLASQAIDTGDPAALRQEAAHDKHGRWTFHPLQAPPGAGQPTDNPPGDTTAQSLTPAQGPRLRAKVLGQELTIAHFDLRGDRLPATLGGQEVVVHTVDGFRQWPWPQGLTNLPRPMHGAVERTSAQHPDKVERLPVFMLVSATELRVIPLAHRWVEVPAPRG